MALGLTYFYLGEHPVAIRQLELAHKLHQQAFRPTDTETLECIDALASAYQAAGRIDEVMVIRPCCDCFRCGRQACAV